MTQWTSGEKLSACHPQIAYSPLFITQPMAHEIAKLILEHADSVGERAAAIRTALSLGMPLNLIEEYLDWLDQVRPLTNAPADDDATGPQAC